MSEFQDLIVEEWYIIYGEGPHQYLPYSPGGDSHFVSPDGYSFWADRKHVSAWVSPEWVARWLKYKDTMLSKHRNGIIIGGWESWANYPGEGSTEKHYKSMRKPDNVI